MTSPLASPDSITLKVIAVVPAYNEAKRLGDVLLKLKTKVDEVVVVDDGSRDATQKVAREAGVVILKHVVNRGQGLALRTGTEAALRLGADIIIHFDADGQHDENFLETLILPLQENSADVVFGSRFLEHKTFVPFFRRVILRGGHLVNRVIFGVPLVLTDSQSGLRALTASAATYLLNNLSQDGSSHASEILGIITRSQYTWREVPVKISYTADTRGRGQNKNILNGFRIIWQGVRHKLHR